MSDLLRDCLLSFCPSSVRIVARPGSTARVTAFAIWTGLAQFLGFSLWLSLRYRTFILARLAQWAPHLVGTSETVQSTALIISTLEFLIYPASLVLLYFALEGLARFAAGLISAEVVPSLPVFVAFRVIEKRRQRLEARRLASLPADIVEFLTEGRIRIASARFRPAWKSTITIGIRGEFYEIENKEPGYPGRRFVFVLKPAAIGRALRAYEEYDLDAATVRDKSVAMAAKPGEKRHDQPVEN